MHVWTTKILRFNKLVVWVVREQVRGKYNKPSMLKKDKVSLENTFRVCQFHLLHFWIYLG